MSKQAPPRTTIEFLDAVRAKLGGVSDYRAAIALGVTRATVSSWRQSKTKIGEDKAPRVAELLELPPEYVLACVAAERAKRTELRVIWERLAKHAKSLHVLTAVGLVTIGGTHSPPAHAERSCAESVYSVKRRRWFGRGLERRRGDRRRHASRIEASAAA